MNKRRLMAPVIALVAAAILATFAYADLTPGTKAPNFSLPTLSGKTFTLSDNFRKPGKVVVLDIWATWCPPCRAEIPYFVNLASKYKGKPVTFVGASIDTDRSKVESFAKEKKINYTIALDPNANKLAGPYKVKGIPATYIIDKKGIIRYVHSGFGGEGEMKQIDKEIQTLVNEK